PSWLSKCEQSLKGLHDAFNLREGHPSFSFKIINEGTRPAEDALITITGQGHFNILPWDGEGDTNPAGELEGIKLHHPPSPPKGVWKPKTFTGFDDIAKMFESLGNAKPLPIGEAFLSHRLRALDRPRDPNGFYWKPHRPQSPGPEFTLECQQWRHGLPPEQF